MYAVVGCSECQALWIVEDRPERSGCPRCGRTRRHEKRREFVTTEDRDHAREVRASMLAARAGHDEAFAELNSVAELGEQAENAGVDDETYLEAFGLDPAEVAEAGEPDRDSKSRKATVREAVRELDDPTRADVVAYAAARGVSSSYTERALEKLVRAGELTEQGGSYRPV